MASTNFVNGVTLTDDDWFNDVDAVVYGTLTSVTGTNTVTASGPQGLSAYALGQIFRFIPANTNTGAVTLNISSLGAKNVYTNNAACLGGEIRQNVPCFVMYDGTQFQILSQHQPQTLRTPGYTFATLPTAAIGMRAYITDSSVTTFLNNAAGGGASVVPVFYNGTNWVVG